MNKEFNLKETLEKTKLYREGKFRVVKFNFWCFLVGHSFKKPFLNLFRMKQYGGDGKNIYVQLDVDCLRCGKRNPTCA